MYFKLIFFAQKINKQLETKKNLELLNLLYLVISFSPRLECYDLSIIHRYLNTLEVVSPD